jgi:hypothetical protein
MTHFDRGPAARPPLPDEQRVLTDHHWSATDDETCSCGWVAPDWTDACTGSDDDAEHAAMLSAHAAFVAHQADALRAAGLLGEDAGLRGEVERLCDEIDRYESVGMPPPARNIAAAFRAALDRSTAADGPTAQTDGVPSRYACPEHGGACGGDHRGRVVTGLCCGHPRSRHDSFGTCQECGSCPGWIAPLAAEPVPGAETER